MKAKYRDTFDVATAGRVKSEGYLERRKAMYDAARGASGSWGKALRFVAYNNLWNTMEVGRKAINWSADGI